MTILSVNSTFALSSSQLERFAENNILFYDPKGGCGGGRSGGIVTILPGNTVGEKIWNWFASAGISGVSDDASVIAGVMGNLMAESSFNPFVVSSLGFYGLYQAGGSRATTLQAAFNAAGLGNLWGSSPSSVSEETLNTALDVSLTTLTQSDDGSFRTFVNKLGVVANKTPEAYAELFLVIVERAVGGNSPLEDEGVKQYVHDIYNGRIGYNYQGTAGRRNNAVSMYNSYSTYTGDGAITRIRDDTQSVTCSSGYAGSGELIAGGMTLAEAQKFMEPYRAIRPRNYHEAGSYLGRWSINDVNGCASDLENCVAFTQYFICEYAHVCMGLPNGGQVVDRLLSSGKGFINGGTTPRVYAVFSSSTHTGIVLGIDTARNKIIIGEAGCGSNIGYNWTNAHEYDLSNWTNGSRKYAYTDNLINGI